MSEDFFLVNGPLGDPQLIEGDLFRMVIKIPEFGVKSVAATQTEIVTPEVTPEVKRILVALYGDMIRGELMGALGLKDEKHFREHYQQVGIALGLIQMTIPDKPRSSKQRYRLTEKGKQIISS